MPFQPENLLAQPVTRTLSVELEPAQNVFHSLVLLAQADDKPGPSDWVVQTHLRMTQAERNTNRLVMIGLYFSITPLESWPSFPAYVTHLESLSGESLRDRMLEKYASIQGGCDESDETLSTRSAEELDLAVVLASPESYLAFLRRHFDESTIDEDIEIQAYSYVIQPSRMKTLIVDHLRSMWDKYLVVEWERVRPILQDSVNAFHQVDLESMQPLEAARFITGRELDEDKWACVLEGSKQLIFVPNLHIGPYLWHCGRQDRYYIMFGAHLPPGAQFEAPDLSRAEIIVRLNALADDSRLRILHYTSENGEQRAQDLIQMLDLSQSAVSRRGFHQD